MNSMTPGNISENWHLKVFQKAEARKETGCDPLTADWQAILEITLRMAHNHLRDKPGRLLPLQIDNQKEWDFYLDLQEKIDLPPDTYAILSTPSFSKNIVQSLDTSRLEIGDIGVKTWRENTFVLIISDCCDHERIMQISLPIATGSPGIDVYENGRHLADYTYNTTEECVNELAKVPWIFFSPKDKWTREQIIQYTENWFSKCFTIGTLEGLSVHHDCSYAHHPELIKLSPLESIFKLLRAIIPTEYDSLEAAIEATNDLNRDMESSEVIVTTKGILRDEPRQCQELVGRITIEMDQRLEYLEFLEGIKFPDRSGREYISAFDKAARSIYESITGRLCPNAVKI